jgi:hypothetical protein
MTYRQIIRQFGAPEYQYYNNRDDENGSLRMNYFIQNAQNPNQNDTLEFEVDTTNGLTSACWNKPGKPAVSTTGYAQYSCEPLALN